MNCIVISFSLQYEDVGASSADVAQSVLIRQLSKIKYCNKKAYIPVTIREDSKNKSPNTNLQSYVQKKKECNTALKLSRIIIFCLNGG